VLRAAALALRGPAGRQSPSRPAAPPGCCSRASCRGCRPNWP